MTVLEDFLTGSYMRSTMIAPHSDADVDVFIVLDAKYYSQDGYATLLDKVRGVLKKSYTEATDISRNGQAVTIQFASCSMDIVPGFYRTGGGFLIPDARGKRWIPTDPKKHVEIWSSQNTAHSGSLVSVLSTDRTRAPHGGPSAATPPRAGRMPVAVRRDRGSAAARTAASSPMTRTTLGTQTHPATTARAVARASPLNAAVCATARAVLWARMSQAVAPDVTGRSRPGSGWSPSTGQVLPAPAGSDTTETPHSDSSKRFTSGGLPGARTWTARPALGRKTL